MSSTVDHIRRIPDPQEPVPAVSWPIACLLVTGLGLYLGSSTLYLTDTWPWWATVLTNAVAGYALFTVAHDTAHASGSSNHTLNTWMGRIATPFFAPHAAYPVWRFIHMQHHRFTNHDTTQDPDHYTQEGPAWQRLPRWATIDLFYLVFYMRHWGSRPAKERREEIIGLTLMVAVFAALLISSGFWALAVIVLIPGRLTIIYLAWAFDYLPHAGLHHKPAEDKFKATRIRVGGERLLSPVMLYQNYHLVHHLHPRVPFHKYVQVWRRNETSYLDADPAMSTVRGRPLTVTEYRELRQLEEGHAH